MAGVTLFGRGNSPVLHNGDKEVYIWNIGDSLGQFLELPYPVTKVKCKTKIDQSKQDHKWFRPSGSGVLGHSTR